MDFDIQDVIVPLVAFLIPAIGLLIREIHYRRKAKRLATEDAVSTLNQKRALIESLISKADDSKDRNNLIAQLDEVNAALLGLYAKRLRNTLKEAGLPTEDALIADGQSRLNPQEVDQLKGEIAELQTLPQSDSIWDLLALANAYYYSGQYEDARETYDRILSLNPSDPTTLHSRGVTYGQLGKYDEALADFNRLLELRPDAPVTLINRGNAYTLLARYDEAFADLNRSLELDPDNPAAFNNRGNAYFRLERYDEAFADFNRSLELRPDDADTLSNRGRAYARLGRYDEALADFNRSLEHKPDDPDTIYDLACVFSLWGKPEDSIAYLKRAIELDRKSREKAKTDKDFDNIREDPRFKKLLESD